LVVELTGNAAAFFFLGVEQFPAERLPGGFSAPAFAHLAPESLVSLDQLDRAFLDKTFELSRAIGQLVVRIAKLTLRSVLSFKKIAYLKLSTPGTQRHFDGAQKRDRADWPFQQSDGAGSIGSQFQQPVQTRLATGGKNDKRQLGPLRLRLKRPEHIAAAFRFQCFFCQHNGAGAGVYFNTTFDLAVTNSGWQPAARKQFRDRPGILAERRHHQHA
jgi:hypothetical protein